MPRHDTTTHIDAVLVSHLHLDHLDAGSMRRLPREVPVIAPTGAGALLRRLGFGRTTEVSAGETVQVAGVTVAAVPAVHDGRRHPLAPLAEAVGYGVKGGHPVYFPRGTGLFAGIGEI